MFGISNKPISIEPLNALSTTQDIEDTYNWIVEGLKGVSYPKVSVGGRIGDDNISQIESIFMRFEQEKNAKNYQLHIFGMPQDAIISPKITISISRIRDYSNFQCTGDSEEILYKFVKYLNEHRNRLQVPANPPEQTEGDFLKQTFNFDINNLNIEDSLKPIISARIAEINKNLEAKAYLSVVILSGSTLEGVLLGIAKNNLQKFNTTQAAPKHKDTGVVKHFGEWGLSNFIDVACELGLLQVDTKKFSHTLREFRNYIHPNEQLKSNFHPNEHTAKICYHVLQGAISNLIKSTTTLQK